MRDKTPFEQAGYTKDTEFRVISSGAHFNAGDVVKLKYDDTSTSPCFVNEKTRKSGYMYLPGHGLDDSLVYHLEVYSENPVQLLTTQSAPECSPTITHNLTIKGHTHVLTTEELCEVFSIIEAAVG